MRDMTRGDEYKGSLRIGQRIHSALYGGRDGIVYAIKGEQCPNTIKRLGGVIATGGNALFDIIYEDGTESPRVPEAILHGPQWYIAAEDAPLATDEEIKAALAFAAQEEERRSRESAKAAEDREKLRAALPGQYPFLTTFKGSKKSPHALGAANIKKHLSVAFRGVAFSVTSDIFSGGNSIDVRWKDGPTTKAVNDITDRYQTSDFDGMQDISVSRGAVFPEIFGGAKYVFEHRDFSPEAVDGAISALWQKYRMAEQKEAPPQPTYEDYKTGAIWRIKIWPDDPRNFTDHLNEYLSALDLMPAAPAQSSSGACPAEPPTPPDTGATITRNPEKSGIEIRFPAKPDDSILVALRSAGFRFSRRQSMWYAKDTPATAEAAQRIVGLSDSSQPAAANQGSPAADSAPSEEKFVVDKSTKERALRLSGRSSIQSFKELLVKEVTAKISTNRHSETGFFVDIKVIAKSERMKDWKTCTFAGGETITSLWDHSISYFGFAAPADLLVAPLTVTVEKNILSQDTARTLAGISLRRCLNLISQDEETAETAAVLEASGFKQPEQPDKSPNSSGGPGYALGTPPSLGGPCDACGKPTGDRDEVYCPHCKAAIKAKNAVAGIANRHGLRETEHGFFKSQPDMSFVCIRAKMRGDEWVFIVAWSRRNEICGSIGSSQIFSDPATAERCLVEKIAEQNKAIEAAAASATPETEQPTTPDSPLLTLF